MAKKKGKSHRIGSFGRSAGGIAGTVLPAMAYGAMRAKLSNALTPITSKLPLGNISDEVGIGILAILAKRTLGKRMPIVANVANAALMIESARIGEAIITGQVGLGGSSSSSSMAGVRVYG